MSYPSKKQLTRGMLVEIRHDKTADTYSKGYIDEILSNVQTSKGILVRLTNSMIGRVVRIVPPHELKKENFKFYNEFIFNPSIYSVWDNTNKAFYKHQPSSEISYCFIATEKVHIQTIIDKQGLENCTIRAIPKNKKIWEVFWMQHPLYFLINGNRKIKYTRLKEIEDDLKSKSSSKKVKKYE